MSPRGQRRLARGRKAFNGSEWQAGGKGKLETRRQKAGTRKQKLERKSKPPPLQTPQGWGTPFGRKSRPARLRPVKLFEMQTTHPATASGTQNARIRD